jgi:hypothetical protein
MATGFILRINNTINDATYVAQPTYYVDVDASNDYFIFSNGSAAVADGQSIPSATDLNRAGTQLDITEVTVGKYFLADVSVNLLKEIKLAGNQNKKYVFCLSFDGETASEPQLEAWDDDTLTSYSIIPLGTGIPNNSWYKAVCTTTNAPGVDWVGTPIAGDGVGNIILLNDGAGALSVAKDLYFNFKIVIPGGVTTPGAFTPVLNVSYLTN